MKIAGSGVRSVCQRYGSADQDPYPVPKCHGFARLQETMNIFYTWNWVDQAMLTSVALTNSTVGGRAWAGNPVLVVKLAWAAWELQPSSTPPPSGREQARTFTVYLYNESYVLKMRYILTPPPSTPSFRPWARTCLFGDAQRSISFEVPSLQLPLNHFMRT